MKKHYFSTAILLILFSIFAFLPKMQAQTALPTDPFGVTGVTCLSPCSILVGYVNFEYTGAGTVPASWTINNVQPYGPATQSIATTCAYTNGSVYYTSNYSIVKNPSTMNGGGQTFQNVNVPGGLFVTHNQGDCFTYTITGLNSLASLGITASMDGQNNFDTKIFYCVRIKMRNVGTQGGCSNVGNNIGITFLTPTGGAFSNGDQLWEAYNSGGIRYHKGWWGKYSVTNSLCPAGNRNSTWSGNGQISNPLGYDSDYTTLEGVFAVGGNRTDQASFRNDDGFQIKIKGLDRNGDNVFGIESIEVYGCLPMKVEAYDGLAPTVMGTNFCENSPVDIKAIGAGFGTNIQWYKGEGSTPPTSSGVIGTGNIIHVTAPQGVGTSDKYWAVGNINGTQVFDTIRIYSVFCCSTLGETNIVFEENFPLSAPTMVVDGTTISRLDPAHGTTTYTYIADYAQYINNGCSATNYNINNNHLKEGAYAIVPNSHWCFWSNRTQVNEHTGAAGSGAMMINADSDVSKIFYQLQLQNLCPNTQYEFSAWYVSIANAGGEQPSDILFQIFESTNLTTPIASGSTGLFGGTANSAHNSSFVWRKKTIIFTTPSTSNPSTQYILRLKNNSGEAGGNDLLIDDIVVTKCIPTIYLYETGTNNTTISVCSGDNVPLSVELSVSLVNLISANTGTVYAQLMSSTNRTTWTAVGTPQILNGSGTLNFSAAPPATGTVYYRVKISVDQARAANVNLSLTNGCYNDVITQTFEIIRDGTMNSATDPTFVSHTTCPPYKDYYEFTGYTYSTGATLWGWALNDTTGMTLSSDPADKNFRATQNGTYYFVYTNGSCRAYKTIVISDIFTDVMIPAITITAPAAVCEGSPLYLTAPTISATVPVTSEGWLLDGQPFTSGTIVTAADNGKTLKYVASNECDTKYSNEVTIVVNAAVPELDERDVCKTEFESGWHYNAFGRDTIFRAGTIAGEYHFYSDCQHKILTINILDAVNSQQPQFPQICADEAFFYIQVEPTGAAGDVTATEYEVIFPAGSGFATQTGSVEDNNKIRVNIPTGIYPNIYSCDIVLSNPASCSSKTFTNVRFSVLYPSTIIEQKWNDVMALLNPSYNGGYQFAGYQWYKSGQKMEGETHSYIYLGAGNTFVVGDEYSVEITRADGTSIFSCPFLAHEPREIMSDTPIVINGQSSIGIKSNQKCLLNIYSVTGILVGQQNITDYITDITIPLYKGMYIFRFTYQNGTTTSCKVVKN